MKKILIYLILILVTIAVGVGTAWFLGANKITETIYVLSEKEINKPQKICVLYFHPFQTARAVCRDVNNLQIP